MSKVKIKILLTDRVGDMQTETLSDCGFSAGDIVLADVYDDGGAVVDADDFERANWGGGFIYLESEEFVVIE